MADQAPLIRYVGDDWWFGPVVLGGDGKPLDLTGATITGLFYAHSALDPVATLTEGSGILVAADRTTGTLIQVCVPRSVTAAVKPQTRRDAGCYPTRLALVVKDSQNKERTWMLVLFLPLDRRCDVPPAVA